MTVNIASACDLSKNVIGYKDGPAGSLREDDEMRMLQGPLDEFDAGEILPVSHGLFEEGLVSTGEVGVDLVRDDAVVPDALFAGSGRSPDAAA